MNDEQRELISAFNDGQLDEIQTESAKRLLAKDAEARRYLEEITRLDNLLRSSFGPIAREPLSPAFYALLSSQQKPRRTFSHQFVPVALAASLLLAAVVIFRQDAIDRQLQDQFLQMKQDIAALKHQTLENIPSGEVASWVAPVGLARAEVTPLNTYRTTDNRFCREYEERIEDADGVEVRRGVACRAGKGQWPDLARNPALRGKAAAGKGGAGIDL